MLLEQLLINHFKKVFISLLYKIEKTVKILIFFFPIKTFLKWFTKKIPLWYSLTFPIEKTLHLNNLTCSVLNNEYVKF